MSHDSDANVVPSEAERMRLSRRMLVGGVAASASGLALAGIQPTNAADPLGASLPRFQDGGQGIIIGTLGEASTINPFQTDESEGDWRCKMLFDEFVRPDPETYAPNPGIAASWKIDGLSFIFAIQPDATFSDGSDLTADDVKFTLEGFLNPETASPRLVKFAKIAGADEFAAGTAEGVSGVEVIDPKTVKITLAEPDSAFLYNMRYLFVVPKVLLEGKDIGNASTEAFFQSPVGAGAYVYESWVVGADFVATANPNFWETDEPHISQFTHRTIADAAALVSALESGDIDGSLYAAPTLVGELEANENLTILVPPFSSPNGTLFNCREAPLDNPQVRRAIAMAVNVPEYVSTSLLGLGDAGLGPIAPDSWAFDETLEPIPFDAERRRRC